MLKLEKSLVFFSASLKSNEAVLEKLTRYEYLKNYPEDRELLEDVIIENKQAIEMANIYSSILSGTMDAFASIISNNLNSYEIFSVDNNCYGNTDYDIELFRNECINS